MSTPGSKTVIGPDMVVKGEIKGAYDVEVRGYVDGTLIAERLQVQPGGRVFGTVRVGSADVQGLMQGDVAVTSLISIGAQGTVNGDVRYGQLALEAGGILDAHVRNVPPGIAGDLNVVVRRGKSVKITTADLTAYDPDDSASDLVFHVSAAIGGRVSRGSDGEAALETFTEAQLEAGDIYFAHDGSVGATAQFDVVVTDRAGASSGAPKTVTVAVI